MNLSVFLPDTGNHEQDEGRSSDLPRDVAGLEGQLARGHASFSSRAMANLVEDIEVLKQGVTSGRDGAVVWIVDRVVEVSQLGTCSLDRHGEWLPARLAEDGICDLIKATECNDMPKER